MYSDFSPPFQRSKVAASKQWRPPHRLICLDLVADGRQVALFISSERSLASADEEDAALLIDRHAVVAACRWRSSARATFWML
jgi:hypothetical protein